MRGLSFFRISFTKVKTSAGEEQNVPIPDYLLPLGVFIPGGRTSILIMREGGVRDVERSTTRRHVLNVGIDARVLEPRWQPWVPGGADARIMLRT
jgi:hypothetical protein